MTIRRYIKLVEATQSRDGDAYFDMEKLPSSSISNPKSPLTLVYMSPDDFLLMAEDGQVPGKDVTATFLASSGTKFYSLPHLGIKHDGRGNAQVMFHDGRHRARALRRLGVRQMPVLLTSIAGEDGQAIQWGRRRKGITLPRVLRGEDGRGEIPMPRSVIFP